MNQTLLAATLRQRVQSPVRLVLLFAFFSFPLIPAAFMHGIGLAAIQTGSTFALVLGAGMIGQDLSAGTLQLLFARPVSRGQYALSRWLAVGLGAACMLVIQIVAVSALLAARGEAPGARAILLVAGQQILAAFGSASVLLLYSTLLPGIGDLIALLLTGAAAQGVQIVGTLSQKGWITRAGAEIGRFAAPGLDLAPIFGGGPVSWFEITSYFSTVALCLALAIVVLNARELSYATD